MPYRAWGFESPLRHHRMHPGGRRKAPALHLRRTPRRRRVARGCGGRGGPPLRGLPAQEQGVTACRRQAPQGGRPSPLRGARPRATLRHHYFTGGPCPPPAACAVPPAGCRPARWQGQSLGPVSRTCASACSRKSPTRPRNARARVERSERTLTRARLPRPLCSSPPRCAFSPAGMRPELRRPLVLHSPGALTIVNARYYCR